MDGQDGVPGRDGPHPRPVRDTRTGAGIDFSSPYYEATQGVIASVSSPIADVTSLADLKGAKLGAQVNTTGCRSVGTRRVS